MLRGDEMWNSVETQKKFFLKIERIVAQKTIAEAPKMSQTVTIDGKLEDNESTRGKTNQCWLEYPKILQPK